MTVVALLGKTLRTTTPPTTSTPSGLKYKLPPTVVSRLKLDSVQPGQSQCARSLTLCLPHVSPAGHTTLISTSVLACAASPLTSVSSNVPLMNLWKTRTLPGCSESLCQASAAAARTSIMARQLGRLIHFFGVMVHTSCE